MRKAMADLTQPQRDATCLLVEFVKSSGLAWEKATEKPIEFKGVTFVHLCHAALKASVEVAKLVANSTVGCLVFFAEWIAGVAFDSVQLSPFRSPVVSPRETPGT